MELANERVNCWLNVLLCILFYGCMRNFHVWFSMCFRNHSNIRIWDSSTPFVEEYIRACTILQRVNYGPLALLDPADSYLNCHDFIHAGYSTLSFASQFLYNDVCKTYQVWIKPDVWFCLIEIYWFFSFWKICSSSREEWGKISSGACSAWRVPYRFANKPRTLPPGGTLKSSFLIF